MTAFIFGLETHLLQFSAEPVRVVSLLGRRLKHWDHQSPVWHAGWPWSSCCLLGVLWSSRSWPAGVCATGRQRELRLPRFAPPFPRHPHLRCSGCCHSLAERQNKDGGYRTQEVIKWQTDFRCFCLFAFLGERETQKAFQCWNMKNEKFYVWWHHIQSQKVQLVFVFMCCTTAN